MPDGVIAGAAEIRRLDVFLTVEARRNPNRSTSGVVALTVRAPALVLARDTVDGLEVGGGRCSLGGAEITGPSGEKAQHRRPLRASGAFYDSISFDELWSTITPPDPA
jgi:hypothetical protein